MSRVAKKPVPVPKGVEVTLDGNLIKVKGPKGALEWKAHPLVAVVFENNELKVSPQQGGREADALAPGQPLSLQLARGHARVTVQPPAADPGTHAA